MQRIKLAVACCLLFPSLAFSSPHYGATFSYGLIGREPDTIHGFQLMASYDPDRYHWRQFNVYFDGGYSHFWITNTAYYSSLNVYAIAPVVRYTFKRHGFVLPYLELSIGLSYLSQTHLDDRNLGIHFAFQDRMGVGSFIGRSEKFTLGIHAVHYSNAHLSDHNSGITMPLVLDIGYRF